MSEKQFVVNELEILNEENDWEGEYWWAVVNTQRVEDCFECRNKEVALKLCDFLNKASDDFKWQINRCEKWSAIVKQLKKEKEHQKEEIVNSHKAYVECLNENKELKKENEKLRQEIERLKKELDEKCP